VRNWSHNLVVGPRHEYTGGEANVATNSFDLVP
jgi:hypothetical protein